jgi:hypothetical protein
MKNLILLTLATFITNILFSQQISISVLNSDYIENFNTLAITSTSTVVPNGWYFIETGTNANTTYTAGAGTNNTGDTYSLGLISTTERSLGGLRSGNLNPTYGCKITNNTTQTIESITVTYRGETWRVGSSNRIDRIDFSYSTNATSLTTGNWSNFDNLDYQNPGQATASGSEVHSKLVSSTIFGLNINPGQSIWFRFSDFDATSSDDAMGIDDFVVSASAATPLPIELIEFDGEKVPPMNKIWWSTASEVGSDYFMLQRSTNGQAWETIYKTLAAGNSNQIIDYCYYDNTFDLSINYYRLLQYDYDSQYKVYGPISIMNIDNKEIEKIVDITGKPVDINSSGLILIFYKNGDIIKKYN